MAADQIRFTAFNLSTRLAITEDGRALPIIRMVDEDGDDTNDPEEAVALVVEDENAYYAVNMREAGCSRSRTLH